MSTVPPQPTICPSLDLPNPAALGLRFAGADRWTQHTFTAPKPASVSRRRRNPSRPCTSWPKVLQDFVPKRRATAVARLSLRGYHVVADGLCNHRHASLSRRPHRRRSGRPCRSAATPPGEFSWTTSRDHYRHHRELVRTMPGSLMARRRGARVARFLANSPTVRRAGVPRPYHCRRPPGIGSYLGLTLETWPRVFAWPTRSHPVAHELELRDVDQLRVLQNCTSATARQGTRRGEPSDAPHVTGGHPRAAA